MKSEDVISYEGYEVKVVTTDNLTYYGVLNIILDTIVRVGEHFIYIKDIKDVRNLKS